MANSNRIDDDRRGDRKIDGSFAVINGKTILYARGRADRNLAVRNTPVRVMTWQPIPVVSSQMKMTSRDIPSFLAMGDRALFVASMKGNRFLSAKLRLKAKRK